MSRRPGIGVAAALAATAALSGCGGHPTRTSGGTGGSAPATVRVAANEQVPFTLVLRPRDPAALSRQLAAARSGHAKPISAAAYGARFGPRATTLAALRQALRNAGITPGTVPPQRTVVHARGPARAVERLLGVRLIQTRGRAQRAGPVPHHPVGRPRIPPTLTAAVSAVSGLDTRPFARPASFPAGGLRPGDAARAYALTALHDAGIDGRGQTIAVLSLDSFNDADVAAYDKLVGIRNAPPVKHVKLDPSVIPAGGQIEVNLDIDVIRAVAPRATILDYESLNVAGAFGNVIEHVVADGKAKIVSVSWGVCEATLAPGERSRDAAEFRAAVARGITIVVASGDSGAYECQRFDPSDQRLTVSWPAASADVLAAGGTTLALDAQRQYAGEAGWEGILSGVGGGGGLAAGDTRPTWQRGTGVVNRYSNGRRQVPDVASAGDVATGWLSVAEGFPAMQGGTSAAAPFWAASLLLVDQAARQAGAGRIGFAPPLLYRIASSPAGRAAFHDVTAGGNRFYTAGPGWDYATGLGSPRVAALSRAVVADLKGQRR